MGHAGFVLSEKWRVGVCGIPPFRKERERMGHAGFVLREKWRVGVCGIPPFRKERERMGHPRFVLRIGIVSLGRNRRESMLDCFDDALEVNAARAFDEDDVAGVQILARANGRRPRRREETATRLHRRRLRQPGARRCPGRRRRDQGRPQRRRGRTRHGAPARARPSRASRRPPGCGDPRRDARRGYESWSAALRDWSCSYH